jgi:osmotically-inducible protein OsmY
MDMHERARAALRKSNIPDLRGLTVSRQKAAVVLEGYVSSFYHKQLAQEVVRRSIGDAEVVNDAKVVYRHDGD